MRKRIATVGVSLSLLLTITTTALATEYKPVTLNDKVVSQEFKLKILEKGTSPKRYKGLYEEIKGQQEELFTEIKDTFESVGKEVDDLDQLIEEQNYPMLLKHVNDLKKDKELSTKAEFPEVESIVLEDKLEKGISPEEAYVKSNTIGAEGTLIDYLYNGAEGDTVDSEEVDGTKETKTSLIIGLGGIALVSLLAVFIWNHKSKGGSNEGTK